MENLENRQGLSTQDSSPWAGYYEATAANPPHTLLVESLEYLPEKGEVLDLGAGLGTDSKYLSEQGYAVTALDSDSIAAEHFQNNQDSQIAFVRSNFTEYNFPSDTFILINAQYALPFIRDKERLVEVIHSIKGSLKKDGVFVGQLFGDESKWLGDEQRLACLTREEIESLFSDMNMIKFHEQIQDGKTATGERKYWQVFHIIAQKK